MQKIFGELRKKNRDPLEIFDAFNEWFWHELRSADVRTYIGHARARIRAEDTTSQYGMVLKYIRETERLYGKEREDKETKGG